MAWTNGPITLYHGTDDLAAAAISTLAPPLNHSINLSYSKALTDFGPGFYTTTSLHQAKNWANNRYKRAQTTANPSNSATVLSFDVNRNSLACMRSMTFVIENSGPDFWDLITHCRNGVGTHLLQGSANYDVVYGPVSLWPQTLVIKDCDQVGFHTDRALRILPTPSPQHGRPKFK